MRNIYILFLCLFALNLAAANFENLPTEVVQPDGSVLSLFASGDEYANWLHDAAGYTIIQSPSDGYYYYATSQNGEPVPSAWRADSSDPSALGLRPGINISPEKYRQKVQLMNDHPRRGARGPNTGTVNNLVVYIRFADQTEFTEPRSVYDAKFNADGDQDNSLRNYFHLVSYDQLNYVSHHFPTCAPDINLSYQDSHPRAYYLPYNAVTNPQGYRDWQRTDREHALLAAAIAGIASQVPTDLNIDADEDGYVDNVCFIIRGPHTAWNDLLWAHRWALYTVDSYINNKMVWDFTFQPEDQNTVRTLCHEMFHSAGAPDLYHYNFDGMTPAGCWDIMESGYGHMGMYMKFRYGNWISTIPTVTSGTYILNPVTSATNNAIKYQLTASEFLVFEYRKQGSDLFEESLPGSGLLIYRINSTQDGNSQGPPDEVYVYRPDGTNSNNGSLSEATFSEGNYCTEFNQYTNPSCFLTNGTNTPVNVHGIGEAGDTIAFTISAPAGSYPPVISNLSPADGAVLILGDQTLSASVSAPSDAISQVQFYLDSVLIGAAAQGPYSVLIPATSLTPGYHDLTVNAVTSAQMSSTAHARIRIVDPALQNWFSWLSDQPEWTEFGRGAVPIQAALDLDLGTQDYLVKKIAFNLVPDPWGVPTNPGLVSAKINRFAGGAITDQTLLNIGDILCPLNGRFEYTVDSQVPLSGKIAVILNLYEYQNIVFDVNGPCGHSWITEPSRPWTDALGRGVIGAADIELLLQAPGSGSNDPVDAVPVQNLSVAPNPFSDQTAFSFDLKAAEPVRLAIYNLRGQKVRNLVDEGLAKGTHRIEWDGLDEAQRPVGSGIYLYRLQSGPATLSGKLMFIR